MIIVDEVEVRLNRHNEGLIAQRKIGDYIVVRGIYIGKRPRKFFSVKGSDRWLGS